MLYVENELYFFALRVYSDKAWIASPHVGNKLIFLVALRFYSVKKLVDLKKVKYNRKKLCQYVVYIKKQNT
jgi:hypothetical protein